MPYFDIKGLKVRLEIPDYLKAVLLSDVKKADEYRIFFDIYLALAMTFLGYSLTSKEIWSLGMIAAFGILAIAYLWAYIKKYRKMIA